jgi:hypothetical protein
MIHVTMRTAEDVIVGTTTAGITVNYMVFANTTAARRTVRVHHVIATETGTTANAILYDAAIAPNSTLVVEMRIAVKPGESLRGKADANGVTATIYGSVG